MPRSLWKSALLAAALGLVAWSGAARAQDVETVKPFLVDQTKPHPVLKFLHIPAPCWASHNGYGCGTLRSEGVFIFGSCREFFGEPCLNGPPPPPWVEGDAAPLPRGGCNCHGW